MFRAPLLKKLLFIRNMVYGMGREEAWVSAFDIKYTEEALKELCCDEEFQDLRSKYEDEIKSTGETRDACVLEIEELKRQAAEIGAMADSPKDKLEAIKVQMKGVETKAKISRKLGEKQEINVAVALPIMGDEAMLKAMESRNVLPTTDDRKEVQPEVVDAEFTEVNNG